MNKTLNKLENLSYFFTTIKFDYIFAIVPASFVVGTSGISIYSAKVFIPNFFKYILPFCPITITKEFSLSSFISFITLFIMFMLKLPHRPESDVNITYSFLWLPLPSI